MSDFVREIYKRLAASPGHPLYLEHRDAIRTISAVLDLHTPKDAQRTYGDRRQCCKTCDDGRSVPVWPCPTVTLMASALNVPQDRSAVSHG
jgi:hypothetical protein